MSRRYRRRRIAVVLLVIVLLAGFIFMRKIDDTKQVFSSQSSRTSPLADRSLYVDNESAIVKLVNAKIQGGLTEEANLLNRISSQPQALWLSGPTADDPVGLKDIATVARTSEVAHAQSKLVVYQLYAVPNRDACAGYSKNGFTDNASYTKWLDSILAALKGEAIFLVEADAIAHIVQGNCLSLEQAQQRYDLLRQVSIRLGKEPKAVATYLDAGHPDWFPDTDTLVEPLRKAGVEYVRGIVVNTSFYVPTAEATKWSQELISKLGNDKGAVIDTSRNGKGLPPARVRGEARWCNPQGRGLGRNPTTNTQEKNIDAYLWVKRPGESDGQCGGNPPAGVLSEKIALELVKNAEMSH